MQKENMQIIWDGESSTITKNLIQYQKDNPKYVIFCQGASEESEYVLENRDAVRQLIENKVEG